VQSRPTQSTRRNADPGPEELWTTAETAAFLKVPVATLYRWRYMGSGPPAHKVGRHLR
jgi:hypothetical protein